MGVSYLYTFLRNIGALRKVNISEEADFYRYHNNNESPVLAVDGINLMYSIYRYYNISWLTGGQLKEYMEHLECFIESFQREGINLIFFFDGPNVMFNVDGWINRKRQVLEEMHCLFDRINSGESLKSLSRSKNCSVLSKNVWAVTIFLLRQKGCEIKISVAECDRELALYGRENDCMGILAADTDFIIYDTVRVFTTIDMDLHNMSFNIYEKRKVLECLMLRSSELPILASLVGNDFTQSAGLNNNQHKKWNGINVDKKFKDTALYIRKLNLKICNGRILKSDINRISRDIFGDENRSKLLQDSINFYDIKSGENGLTSVLRDISDYKWHSIVKMVYKKFNDNSDSMGVIIRQCFQDYISLQDFRCKDIPPVAKVLKALRERIYGILLFEKPGSKKVIEWLIDGYESLARPEEAHPQFPNVHHPGLLSLIRNGDEDIKWSLLGDIFDIDPTYMKNLDEHLLIPAVSFRYLKNKVIILKWEINALVLSAVIVRYFNAEQLRLINLDQIKSRPIRLYNLVTCSFETVLQIFQIFGNLISAEMALPSNYQDGNLFQLVYQLSVDNQMSVKEILMNIFDSYLENSKDIETPLRLFDLVSSFLGK